MAIAITIQHYLEDHGIQYNIVPHEYSRHSMETAEKAHIHGDQVAKCVVLEDKQGFLAAVLPATHKIQFNRLTDLTHRYLKMADEQELADTFGDCVLGAIPPLGTVYNVKVICDDAICEHDDVYFESGDHTDLIHVSGEDFRSLMASAQHGRFSHHM